MGTGAPTFAQAYSGFPVDIACVDELHAAFLIEASKLPSKEGISAPLNICNCLGFVSTLA
jgi:hypothetical protein